MKQKFWQVLFSVILMAGMLLGLVQPQPVQAAAPADPPVVVEVEPELRTQLQADQTTGYWIYLREKADLSAAYDMDWSARGWYVMNTLQETANRTQANVLAYLDAQGARYQSFWIDNVILVEQSNSRTFNGLLNFSEIETLRARRTPVLYEPVEVTAGVTGGDSPDAINPDLLHINVDDVWAGGVTGQGIVVGNIDTGVRYTHEALVAQYRGNNGDGTYTHDYNWYDPPYLGSDLTPNDPHNHGSHTMGTMLGSTSPADPANATRAIGMAPGAKWIACQGFDTSSGGADDAALLSCGQFMAAPTTVTFTNPNPDMRPNVVNNSWGDCGQTYDNWYAGVISAWHAAGVYPMFSNGNASNCGYSSPPGLNTVGNPARSGNVTGVGSTGTSDGTYATYSNWGPTDDPDTINPMGYPNLKPQIVAPGSNTSAYGSGDATYGGMTGTSMASPHAAGLVALMWSAAPCLVGDYAATETIIQETAVPKPYNTGSGLVVPNYATGWGEIDAQAAVQAAADSCGGQGALDGTVTEALKAPGDPLAGVTITAYPQGSGVPKTATTDASGYYTLTLTFGWYDVEASSPFYTSVLIEDIEIITGTVETQDFAMDPKAQLWGFVTDADNGFGLDATVTADNGEFVNTNPSDGAYALYLDAGTYTVTATATDYAPATVTNLVLASGVATQQDFALLAAVSFTPAPLEITLELGNSGTVPVTLTNNQPTPYDYEFIEKAPLKAPTIGEDVLVVAYDTAAAAAMEAALTANGYTYLEVTATAFNTTPVVDLLTYQAVFWAGNTTSTFIPHLIAYLDAGGSLYISDNDLGFSNNSTPFYQTYLQATYGGDNGKPGVTGLGIMAGLNPDVSADPYPDYFSVKAEGVEIFEYTSGNSAGVSVDRMGYKAIYTAWDFDDIASTADETELVLRVMDYLAVPDDVPWFDITPDSGTVPATNYILGTATFTATAAVGVTQPGEYEMTLKIDGDPKVEVPVIMTVDPTATQGQIDGTVTSDRPGGPLEALITMEDSLGGVFTTTSDAGTGYYTFWLEADTYTVTASAPGYLDGEEVVVVTADATATQDFELMLDAPDIWIGPDFLDVTVTFGNSISDTLLVENDGPAPLNFEISERNEAFSPNAGNDILLMGDDLTAADWQVYRDALTAAGVTWDELNLLTQPFPTLVDLTPYTLLIWVDDGTLDPDNAECQIVVDWLNLGDKAFFGGGVDFLWDIQNGTAGLGERNLYDKLQTVYVGDYAGTTITALDGVPGDLIGGDFAPPNSIALAGTADSNGDYANDATSVATTALLYGTGGTGSGYAAMTYYEGANYKTAWLGLNFHLGLTDQAERNLLMENVLIFLYGGGDILWLSESPITGTVPAAGWTEVDVTFDSSVVAEPGVYMAELVFKSNDPLEGRVTIPVTMTVEPSATVGRLEGIVTSDRPGAPLEATIVIEDSGGVTWTVVTDPANGYYYRWLDAGTYTVTASATGYLTEEAVVDIVGQTTTPQDFVLILEQPEIAVSPLSMEETLVFGDVATQTLYIENIGYADLEFSLAEQDMGTYPLAQSLPANLPTLVTVTPLQSESIGSAEGVIEVASSVIPPAPLGGMALNSPDDVLWDNGPLVTHAAACSGLDASRLQDNLGMDTYGFGIQFSAGNRMADDFVVLDSDWTIDQITFYAYQTGASGSSSFTGVYLQIWDGAPNDPGSSVIWGDLTTNRMTSTAFTNILRDLASGPCGTTRRVAASTAAVGITLPPGTYWLDWTLDGSASFTGPWIPPVTILGQTTTGNAMQYTTGAWAAAVDGGTATPQGMPFVIEGSSAQEIPWLSEDPITGTVPMGETGEVEVTFDSGQVPEPGTYIGNLRANSNDPYVPRVTIPVTLTVLPSGDIGLLDGNVQSLGHCDANPVPAAAEIIAENSLGDTFTILSSGATGYYSRWLVADTYTLTVSAPDHLGAEAVVQITTGMTTTHDFDLRWLAPCVSVDPLELEVTVAQGYDWTESLDISNMGAAGTDFELIEAEGGFAPMSNVTAHLPASMGSNSPSAKAVIPARPAVDITFPLGLTSADPISVLILSPDDVTDLQATLAVYPDLAVMVWPSASGNPTAADLAPYQVVVFGNNSTWEAVGFDKVAVGNALADYIDAGGTAIEAEFVQSYDQWGFGGRYMTGGYSPFTPASIDRPAADTMTIVEPTHPVMVGVTAITDNIYQQNPGLAAGATLLATWTTSGYNAVAVNESVVAINMLLTAPDWTGDVGTLLHNAIVWLSGGNEPADVPWVSEIPVTGTVDADSVFTVDVTFVATETMPLGTYTATLVLGTDDLGGDIEIPLTMHVVGSTAPDVSFTAEELICEDMETIFTNTSIDGQPPAEYVWDFGDGTVLTTTFGDVTHTYVDAWGTFEVTLEACNDAGCDTYSLLVEVVGQPWSEFSYVLNGATVNFINVSMNADTYLWDFGDGMTSTLENPSHTYAVSGDYEVTLIAYSDCGMDEYTATVTVVVPEPYLRIYLPVMHKYVTINK